MHEVVVIVTLQVDPDELETELTQAAADQTGVQAVTNALKLVELNGFSHDLADSVSIGVAAVEVKSACGEYSPEVLSLARDIRALIGNEADNGFFDELVHDLKSSEASDLNNSVLEDILVYLIASGCKKEAYEQALGEADDSKIVTCKFCERRVPAKTAHLHDEGWVGDECCWTDHLHSSE